jgi:hypothetical protein
MKKGLALLGLATALLTLLSGPGLVGSISAATESYTIDWSVIGSGGSAGVQLGGTVGQPAIGWSSGASQLGSGFWYGVWETYVVYLPLVLRGY